MVEAAILKRMAAGEGWGLAVLAEGLLDQMSEEEMSQYVTEYDEHGHPRLSRDRPRARSSATWSPPASRSWGVKMAFITKIIGYELRCADPIAFDVAVHPRPSATAPSSSWPTGRATP